MHAVVDYSEGISSTSDSHSGFDNVFSLFFWRPLSSRWCGAWATLVHQGEPLIAVHPRSRLHLCDIIADFHKDANSMTIKKICNALANNPSQR